jgi:gibberellin A4 carboxyl methyltransferase
MEVTTGMVGRGFYNRHSAPQWAAIDYALPWLQDALVSMNLPSAPDTIMLADFGCSEGKNSIAAMQRLLPILYDRLLPPASTYVATTFNAIGYLSRRPLDRLPGFILPNGPSATRNIGTVSKQERAAFAQQAADDVSAFLTARATELVPGGKLLMQVFWSK